jgi:hypothetical protein
MGLDPVVDGEELVDLVDQDDRIWEFVPDGLQALRYYLDRLVEAERGSG